MKVTVHTFNFSERGPTTWKQIVSAMAHNIGQLAIAVASRSSHEGAQDA